MNSRSKKTTLMLFLVFAVSVGIYLNTLSNGLVRDDAHVVVGNPWITSIKYFPEIVSSPVFDFDPTPGLSNQYRPVYHFFLMPGYAISGTSPWGYHLVNIITHALCAVFVFLIAAALLQRALSKRETDEGGLYIPFFTALIFATHPVNTEPVAWISAISELSFALFALISVYLYITSKKPFGARYIASIIFFFLAACAKETAAAIPLLLFTYDMALGGRRFINSVVRLVPFGAAGVAYLAMRVSVLGDVAPLKAGHVVDLTTAQLFLNVPPLVVSYLVKLLVPIRLNFDYVFHPVYSIAETSAFVPIVTLVVLLLLIWRLYRFDRLLFFAALWIFIPLLPMLYIPALGSNTFTERYLYLPSVGFGLLVTVIAARVASLGATSRKVGSSLPLVVALVLIATLALYSIATVKRNFVWKDGYTLWGDTVMKSPDSRIARNNFGIELARRGKLNEALSEFTEAVKIDPDHDIAYNNLGTVYARQGRYRMAADNFYKALRIKPSNEDARRNLEGAVRMLKTGGAK